MQALDSIDPSWLKMEVFRSELTSACQYCPSVPYVSLIVPESPAHGKTLAVRHVNFTITSHEQGWSSSHTDKKGTYFDSNTFFEADMPDSLGQGDLATEKLFSNRRAEAEPYTHLIFWNHRLIHFKNHTGDNYSSGIATVLLLSDSLSRLRSGHSFHLVPRAMFDCWVNYTLEARIEAWFEWVDQRDGMKLELETNPFHVYQGLSVDIHEIRLVILEPGSGDEEI